MNMDQIISYQIFIDLSEQESNMYGTCSYQYPLLNQRKKKTKNIYVINTTLCKN